MAELKMLGIDLGATSGRGIIGSFDGKKISLEEIHRFDDTSSYLGKTLSWNIFDIFENVKTSIRLAGRDIRSIGIDTWGVDYALIGKDGRMVSTPVNYRDSRTDDIITYSSKFMSSVPRNISVHVISLLPTSAQIRHCRNVQTGS